MKNFMKAMIVSATVALGAISTSGSASADGLVKLGTLTCHTKPGWGLLIGSSRTAKCVYSGINGKTVAYNARLTRIGVDVGYTANQTFVWAVLAPGTRDVNSLKGTYVGASAEATVGIGVGANALVGGMEKSIALQPVSVSMQTGAAVVATVSSLTLSGGK